ncbi:restriction endonuclease subunit S [Prevotella dentalis]|uniref:restriction endonuclease subunit S n=1 Tax=Prevotella dentalis TaxID=52227 RepID=UPI002659856A|nr:restriction endonuclease subunit S [Prevotella dentalis]MCF2637086.1 restriction endonuclease subunit S [Prevotella dentalis]
MNTKALRQKILDLAIHGKLVPQDPNDEPASVLLERIRTEKERLIKEGKIKRPKKTKATSDKPHYENVPFEVPSSWVWTTLGDIAEIITGNTPSKDIKEYYSGNIPFFKPTDLEQGIHTKYSKDRLTPLGFEQSRKLPANSVLVTCIGATIGKTGLTTVEGTCNQQINAIIPTSAILAKFLFYVCISDYMQHEIKANASATTLPILNKANFSKIAITIPPLQEQSRIVEGIEHWLSLVDCIEKNKDNLQRTIKKAKSKILTLAIHGKLVPQAPTDEPASELLKRINPKAEITSDNGHYQKLPEGWCECKLSDVCVFDNGYAFSSDNYYDCGIPLIRISNITNTGSIDLSSCVFIQDVPSNKFIVKSGDLLIAMSGATTGKMGVYLYEEDALLNQRVGNLKCTDAMLQQYRNYYMFAKSDYILKIAYGGAQPNISAKAILDIDVMLPPLNEQHRIVAKIEEIFAQLDAIETSL